MAEKRIKEAKFYDYVVINDDLDRAVMEVKAIIEANRPKPSKVVEFNAENITTETIDTTLEVNGFKIVGSTEGAISLKSSPASFNYNGQTYSITKYLSMGGSKKPTYRYIEFTVDNVLQGEKETGNRRAYCY